jgi:hypothetical protein
MMCFHLKSSIMLIATSLLLTKKKPSGRSFKPTYLQPTVYLHLKEEKMAERSKSATKAKRTSPSKSKTRTADKELQNAAAEEAAVGALNTAEGVENLEAASDVSAASRDLLAEGARDATRGVDALKAAQRAEKRSKKAVRESARDLAEGEELLTASEELAIQSDIVREMSSDDLDHGMKLASIAGQLWATSNVLENLDMPLLASFLDDKGQELQDLAVEVLLRSGTTRVLATAMAETGAEVGELAAGEVAEGIGRLIEAEELENQSELLQDAGEQLAEQGLAEVVASEELSEAAKEIRAEGVDEIATGAEEVGEAEIAKTEADGNKKTRS